MFIVWGTKVVRRRHGRVAEDCPFCDQAQPFSLRELREYPHLYYIPVWRGKAVGWELVCQTCKARLFTETQDYPAALKDRRADLETLITETNPDLPERIGERMALRDRVVADEATEHERLSVIAAPFLACAYPIYQRSQQLHVDRWSLLWLVCTVFTVCALLLVVATQPITGSPLPWAIGWGVAAAVSLVLLIVSFATDARRFAKRRYGKFILRSLEPLNVSRDELEKVLDGLKMEGNFVGKAFRAAKLHEELTVRRRRREAAAPMHEMVPPYN